MSSFHRLSVPEEIVGDLLGDLISGIENWCILFNEFCLTLFTYLKFIFVFIIFTLAILSLKNVKRSQIHANSADFSPNDYKDASLNKSRLASGVLSICFGLGILFNFTTYLLIEILDPLPDRFIFSFINFSGDINPYYLNRIMDIDAAIYPHEKTIYYCVAMASFGAVLDLVISVWYLISKKPVDLKLTFTLLIGGVTTGMLAGFTTCLPFFK